MKVRWSLVLWTAAAVLAIAALAIALTSMNSTGESESFEKVPATGMVMSKVTSERVIGVEQWKSGNITSSGTKTDFDGRVNRRHARLVQLDVGNTGPCYRVHKYKWGNSLTVSKIVLGIGHFHWCVGAQHPENVVSFDHNFEHSETSGQLWRLNWVETSSGGGTSSTWCSSDGTGPCFPVEYKFWRFRYQFIRGATVAGIDLAQHATFQIQCTVRGNSPNVKGNYECYADMLN